MGETQVRVGTVICSCHGTLLSAEDGEQVTARLKFEDIGPIVVQDWACSKDSVAEASNVMSKHGVSKVMFVGCGASRNAAYLENLAEALDTTRAATSAVDIRMLLCGGPETESDEDRIRRIVSAVRREAASLRLVEDTERVSVPVTQRALVIGDGLAATAAASEIAGFGHETVTVQDGTVTAVSGVYGDYEVTIATAGGEQIHRCGAVVVAQESSGAAVARSEMERRYGPGVVPLQDLSQKAGTLKRVPRVRNIGIVLDLVQDETKAATEQALEIARGLQRPGAIEMLLFCREARVASLALEELYDDARNAGVNIVKHDGALSIKAAADGGVIVACADAVLGRRVEVACDLVGVSPTGIDSSADIETAELLGVLTDAAGQMQVNNIHLFPGETNRQGVFVVGPAKGQFYAPEIVRDARAVAVDVHELLSAGTITVETSNAVVDPDKCALCLTCVRACPYDAMVVNEEKGAAESIAHMCRRCGICAGECPAKAIQLPAYADSVVAARL